MFIYQIAFFEVFYAHLYNWLSQLFYTPSNCNGFTLYTIKLALLQVKGGSACAKIYYNTFSEW